MKIILTQPFKMPKKFIYKFRFIQRLQKKQLLSKRGIVATSCESHSSSSQLVRYLWWTKVKCKNCAKSINSRLNFHPLYVMWCVCGKVVNNARNCGFFNDPWSGCQLKEERPTWSGSRVLHTWDELGDLLCGVSWNCSKS